MADFQDNEKLKVSYFHALGKVMTESTQAVYESKYKSSHNVKSSEIWADEISYASSTTMADSEASTNIAVTKVIEVDLTEIPYSNGEAYYLNTGGTFIRPWISPVDVPNLITNDPSYGYSLKLYDSSNSRIGETTGAWSVDYYAGIVHFAPGFTPSDMGWGTPKATLYYYSGDFGLSGSTGSETLSALTDTIIVTPQSGETIVYSGGTWQNKNLNDLYVDLTSNQTVGGDKEFTGDITILSNLTVSGTTTTVNAENLNIKDNIIVLNSGETGDGVTLEEAGLLIDRGTVTDFLIVWDENTETFRAGLSGSTKEITYIEDSKIDGGVVYWDGIDEELKMYDFKLDIFSPQSGETLIYSGGTWVNKQQESKYVSYENDTYNNVQDALDLLTHIPVSVVISAPPYDYFETGDTITLNTLEWNRNPSEVESQIIYATGLTNSSYTINSAQTSYEFGESVSNDFIIKVQADDGEGYDDSVGSDTLDVKFINKVYWGTNSKTSLNSSDISGLTYSGWTYNDEGIETRKRTFQINGNGEYLYYCYPQSLGTSDEPNYPEFKVNGMMSSAWERNVVSFTNQYGHNEDYYVYKSTYIQNGFGIEVEKL